jgi:hypothetical protein
VADRYQDFTVVNGWVNNFFPYCENKRQSKSFVLINELDKGFEKGLKPNNIPEGVSKTSFKFKTEKKVVH